jgi:hypothetical protein
MVVLMSPSPAGVAGDEPAASGRPAVRPSAFDRAIGPWAVEGLLCPYPGDIAPHQLHAFAFRTAEPQRAAAALDPALGPWAIERFLSPYPALVAIELLPELVRNPVMPAATPAEQLAGPVDSALGPWRIEQFVCPYQITVAPRRLPEAVERAAKPLPAPVIFDAALGPWAVERLLFPYPATVAPHRLHEPVARASKRLPAPAIFDAALGPWPVERLLSPYPAPVAPRRLPEFSAGSAEPPHRAAAVAETKPAHTRLVMRVAGTTRKLLGLVERGARAARKALEDLSPSMTPTLGGEAPMPDRGGQAMPSQIDDDAAQRWEQSIGPFGALAPRPAPWPHDDGGSLHLSWREWPQTASDDPFAPERRWTDAADEPTLAPQAIMPPGDPSRPQHVAGFDRFFRQSTGVAFLAALLLVPLCCSYAAGAVYGYARDGPRRRR